MSSPELESDHYDVIVIGTGLSESIAASSLAKSGKTVLHLDPNEYYGGQQASLTLDELESWSEKQNSSCSSSSSSNHKTEYSQISTTPLNEKLESDKRRYAISLFPAILPSRGPLIDTLIKSDVSKYVSFRILDSISLFEPEEGGFKKVPGNKEDIFKDKSISLIDKRKLMKFLLFAMSEFEDDDLIKGKESQTLLQFLQGTFSIPDKLSKSIIYAISHCTSSNEPLLESLTRTRRYLKSIGRYGNSPFLIGQYGGAGEIAQGFCRACAVFGGTYILGSSAIPTSIDETTEGVSLNLPCHPRPVTASHLISSPDHLPPSLLQSSSSSTNEAEPYVTANCIAITDKLPEALRRKRIPKPDDAQSMETDEEVENDDTALIIFPREDGENVVRCYVNGEGTGSCPSGQYIIYLSTSIASSTSSTTSPSEILKPYLSKVTKEIIFESYYISSRPSSPPSPSAIPSPTFTSNKLVTLQPYVGNELLTEGLDWESEQGEKAYYEIMGRAEGVKGFFEKDITEEEEMGVGEDDF